MQFRHFLAPNSFLYINAVLQPGWTNKDTGVVGEPRLKFTNFMLLHDVLDEKCEKITILLNNEEVTKKSIENLHTILKEYEIAGKQKLSFSITERKEKFEITLPSRTMKINASSEFFKRMEVENIRYKMN
jgi:DNA polymerase-3 subunit alpha